MDLLNSTVALITGAGHRRGDGGSARRHTGVGGLVLTDRDGPALDTVAARLDRPGSTC